MALTSPFQVCGPSNEPIDRSLTTCFRIHCYYGQTRTHARKSLMRFATGSKINRSNFFFQPPRKPTGQISTKIHRTSQFSPLSHPGVSPLRNLYPSPWKKRSLTRAKKDIPLSYLYSLMKSWKVLHLKETEYRVAQPLLNSILAKTSTSTIVHDDHHNSFVSK